MTRRRYLAIVLLFLVGSTSAAAQVPATLSDQEFWKISSEFSEADGNFRSDNLLSNEEFFQYALPDLTHAAKPGRVYMGVGPEQNFTYIVALKPTMALIVDIRRGNLDLQLMYKALFELSKDRAEFVSRLFARQRPDGLDSKSTTKEIFAAYAKIEPSEKLYNDNLNAIRDVLVSKHGFPLMAKDLEGIKYVYDAFRNFGPGINYSSTSGGFGGRVTYAELMMATDESGEPRSYLASEENFTILKDLESKNLVVPFVGDFAGPKAIRSIGKYLKGLDTTVSAFYLSNVEQFLRLDGIWQTFCGNAASLPLDGTSTFIRTERGGRYGPRYGATGLTSDLGNMIEDLKPCAASSQN